MTQIKQLMELIDLLWDDTGYMGGNHAGPSLAPCGKEYENGSDEDLRMTHYAYCEWVYDLLVYLSKKSDEGYTRFRLERTRGEEE